VLLATSRLERRGKEGRERKSNGKESKEEEIRRGKRWQ
jgi:hypothetical protein